MGPVLVLLAVAFLASCSSPQDAGAPFHPDLWTVEGPTLRIGSVDDPDYAFQSVQSLAMGPAGILHSLHRGETAIRRWDIHGRPMSTIGRQGEGPGEFRSPSGIGFFGDSLWVMDRQAYRISYFGPDGAFLGTVTPRVDLSPDPENPRAAVPRPFRPLRDGTLYAVAPAWSDAIARGQLSETRHALLDQEGETLGTVWMQDYRPTDVLALLREDGGTFGRQPFGDGSLWAISQDQQLMVLDRRVPRRGQRAAIRLTTISMTGDTLFSKELEYAPEPLPRERIDSASRAQARDMLQFLQRMDPGMTLAALETDLRGATYSPDYLPAVRGMLLGTDGSIWLQRFSPREDGNLWWVLGADGAPLAMAVTPVEIRIVLATADALWGVETDELDVEYIVRYEIVRG
jgi:hypothetical protein